MLFYDSNSMRKINPRYHEPDILYTSKTPLLSALIVFVIVPA